MKAEIGNPEQVCMAQRVQVTDGRGNGARQIYIANGKLNFVLLESNALDIYRLWHEGTNVGFVSKNGLYTAPADFMHAFPCGMLYTCGLDAIGGVPGHVPHGRIHSVPAEIKELRADEKGVKVVGEIRDTALFGENLVVTRTIETAAGSGEIALTDRIENRAFRDEKYCLLYHVNVGYPFIDEDAEIEGDFIDSVPRTEWAAHEMEKMLDIEPPADNMEETCYFHRTADGVMSVVNRRLGRKFTVKSSLRKFVEWKSRVSGDYVLGLEPCTSWLDGKLRYSVLRQGRAVTHSLVLRVDDL
jgi:hypothetical protein